MLSVKLKELRKKHALTQEQLAEKLNVSRQAVAKWESGAGMPDIENLKNISLVFHVSTDSLLDVRIEKDITLKNKFTIIEICLFALGISLGIVAQSFQFGFVMAILLPGIVHSIELTTLERKYRKEVILYLNGKLSQHNFQGIFSDGFLIRIFNRKNSE